MNDNELLDHYSKVGNVISEMFPRILEVVIHDLRHPEKAIVAIFNNHMTGRKVGDATTDLGYQRLDGSVPDEIINYQNQSPDGKKLKSSSLAIRNAKGHLIGSICFNIDTSFFLQFEQFIQLFNQTKTNPILQESEQFFYQSPKEEIEKLVNCFLTEQGLIQQQLSGQNKLAIIQYLYMNGAFNKRGSISIVSDYLKISRQTVYNYLKIAKKSTIKVDQ